MIEYLLIDNRFEEKEFKENIEIINKIDNSKLKKIVDLIRMARIKEIFLTNKKIEKIFEEMKITPNEFESILQIESKVAIETVEKKIKEKKVTDELIKFGLTKNKAEIFSKISDKEIEFLKKELKETRREIIPQLKTIMWRIDHRIGSNAFLADEGEVLIQLDFLVSNTQTMDYTFEITLDKFKYLEEEIMKIRRTLQEMGYD